MKLMLSAVALALALAMSSAMASPQITKSEVSVPSAQNSGVGISGYPGNKNGPAVHPGTTVGSAGATKEMNLAVTEQDPANIQGLPGNKSGPPAQRMPRGGS